MNTTQPIRRGRPKIERISPAIVDIDLSEMKKISSSVRFVVNENPKTNKLPTTKRNQLIDKLSTELIFFRSIQGATQTLQTKKPGPKPRLAHVLLLRQVGLALESAGVKVTDWSNKKFEKTELGNVFKTRLARARKHCHRA